MDTEVGDPPPILQGINEAWEFCVESKHELDLPYIPLSNKIVLSPLLQVELSVIPENRDK